MIAFWSYMCFCAFLLCDYICDLHMWLLLLNIARVWLRSTTGHDLHINFLMNGRCLQPKLVLWWTALNQATGYTKKLLKITWHRKYSILMANQKSFVRLRKSNQCNCVKWVWKTVIFPALPFVQLEILCSYADSCTNKRIFTFSLFDRGWLLQHRLKVYILLLSMFPKISFFIKCNRSCWSPDNVKLQASSPFTWAGQCRLASHIEIICLQQKCFIKNITKNILTIMR